MGLIRKESAMLLDIQYIKPRKNDPAAKDGLLYIIWKDLDTDKKHLDIVENPKMEIYFEKQEKRNHTYNKNYALLEDLNKVVVPYKDIPFYIAKDAGEAGQAKLQNIFQTGNYRELSSFYLYPYVFGSDYDIRSFYRYKWLQDIDNDRAKPLTKGFLDIEVDTYEATGFPQPHLNPIDLVTLIDASHKKVYTFALVDVSCIEKDVFNSKQSVRDKEMRRRELYKQRIEQQHYLIEHQEELKEELHEMFDETYGVLDYNFYFYRDERKLLTHLFELINEIKLDFIAVWNISFDIPYIYDRMKYLGMEPSDHLCHPDFPVKQCYFKKDVRNHDIKNKSDFFHTTSYTTWYDQMILYAAVRKGQQELRSHKLNFIAERVIKDKKLDYSDDGNLKELSYVNYKKYFIYNIKDVLLQYGIEKKTQDLENLYMTSYLNAVPFESVFKQTVKLRNVQYLSFLEQGLVPGSNINVGNYETSEDEDDDDPKFEGALVGDPLLNMSNGMVIYSGKSSNVYHYSIDMD